MQIQKGEIKWLSYSLQWREQRKRNMKKKRQTNTHTTQEGEEEHRNIPTNLPLRAGNPKAFTRIILNILS
jgi:hypothetical protein